MPDALNLKKPPTLPAAVEAYRSLSAMERVELRVALAAERRLRIDTPIAAVSLLAAVFAIVVAAPGAAGDRLDAGARITVLVWVGAVVLFVALAFVLVTIDFDRRRRAWSEVFAFVDAHDPRGFDPSPEQAEPTPIRGIRRWFTRGGE